MWGVCVGRGGKAEFNTYIPERSPHSPPPPDSQLKIGGAAIFPGSDCHQSSAIPPWPMCATIPGADLGILYSKGGGGFWARILRRGGGGFRIQVRGNFHILTSKKKKNL